MKIKIDQIKFQLIVLVMNVTYIEFYTQNIFRTDSLRIAKLGSK